MDKGLKIAIVGYGKMGREIEKYARQMHLDVVTIIDDQADWTKNHDDLLKADVAIEFTAPSVVASNIRKLTDLGIGVVTGTTGWMDQLEDVSAYCRKRNASLFHASNFSIGVNLFFALNRKLAALMADYPEYNLSVEETHHKQKLDAPSGTAISLLDQLLDNANKYTGWKLIEDNPEMDQIPVTAHRAEGVTGTHIVKYQSAIDNISIKHEAHNREGFAKGALMAAKWLKGKKGVFTMKDLLNI